jgi:outer membrane lipoprotein SlyB
MHHIRSLALAFCAIACAANPDPIVDMRGVDPVLYQQDLADCKAYTRQIQTEVGVAKGAAGGAAVGGAVGAISGDTAKGAGIGAVAGGAKSAQLNEREKQQVVKNCMRGRGYRVLN